MNFLGVDKGVDTTQLPEGLSPDAFNCDWHDGREGVLGARKGRAWLSDRAYDDVVVGFGKLLLPDGSLRSVVATNNGDIVEKDLAPADAPTIYITGDTASGKAMSDTSLDLDYPATTAALNTTFDDASSFDPDESLYVSWGLGLSMTGNTGWTGPAKLRIEYGVNESGSPRYCYTYECTADWAGSFALSGAVPAAMHGARNAITGAAFRVSWPDGWPAGAGAGDKVTISSLLMG